jgi:hypothetical protein
MLEPYSDRVKDLAVPVDRVGLIKAYKLDSDNPEVLEEALRQIWFRVALLQNAAVAANEAGDEKEVVEIEAEIAEIRQLRLDTQRRIKELKK